MRKNKIKKIPTLLCDFYKLSHRPLYPEGTQVNYITYTPRSNKYFPIADEVVVVGVQGFSVKYLIDYFNENFFERDEDEVVEEYEFFVKFTLGEVYADSEHIRKLHKLGYLPIKLSALDEGTLAPIKTPILTIENTHPDFYWLPNYLETILSTSLWQMITSATIAHQFRKLTVEHAIKTTGSMDGVGFQCHDFSMRGMSSLETAELSGAGHLYFFDGTDTIPAIIYLFNYYNADPSKELVGSSIVATEHSIMSSGTLPDGDRDEYDAFKRIITKKCPSGFVSIVADTYDFWKNIKVTIPRLKEEIMNRDGRVVIRPDSGNPIKIICGDGKEIESIDVNINSESLRVATYNEKLDEYGELDKDSYHALRDEVFELWHDTKNSDLYYGDDEFNFTVKTTDNKYFKVHATITDFERYETTVMGDVDFEIKEVEESLESKGLVECLWDIFGGTVTEQGYKVLDPHIGAIYGDSITLERAEAIIEGLEAKGFASTNVVFGLGSYTYQMNSRDTLGQAVKCTSTIRDGVEYALFKDPKTDDGTKRSQRGRVSVWTDANGNIKFADGLKEGETLKHPYKEMLTPVFVDGELVKETSLSEIREKVRG